MISAKNNAGESKHLVWAAACVVDDKQTLTRDPGDFVIEPAPGRQTFD